MPRRGGVAPGRLTACPLRLSPVECPVPEHTEREPTPMPLIEAQGLTKTYRVFQKKPGLRGALLSLFRREYKDVQAVADASFTIEPGEMVAFLGPNGAGKTTTLKMLSGLIYPTAGTA